MQNSRENIRVLVTGAKGQLGSQLQVLSSAYPEISFLFMNRQELDITDAQMVHKVISEHKPQFIVNAAGYTAVDRAEEEPEKALLLNATAVGHLAQSAKVNNAKLIHISTDYVFGGQGNQPFAEEDPAQPQTVYGETKLKGEELALASGVAMVIRTSWLYSAFGHNFLKTILDRSAQGKLRVVYDQIGSPTWAHDLAQVIMYIISHSQAEFKTGIYHYSNEGVCSWYDFAKEILRIKGTECPVEPVLSHEFKTLAKRPFYSVLDKQKIKNTFNLTIPHWRDSLEDCLNSME